MDTISPTRTSSRSDAFAWISLGAIAGACVLWLSFAHADRIAAVVFHVEPGELIYDLDVPFHRVLAVWGGGALLAAGLLVAGIVLRREPIDGRSASAWTHLAASLATLAVALVIGREIRGKPVTADLWFVYAGGAAALVGRFWRGLRSA